jgi:hypothetical protein
MGVYVDDVTEFTRSDVNSNGAPLGERLRGMAADLDVDSVEEVRRLREDR